MTDIEPIASYLTGIVADGAPMLGLALFLSALGYPLLPGTLFIIAAGAFVRQGVIHWADSSFLILLGAVLGDSAGYAFGYIVATLAGRRFGHSAIWQKVRETFARRGGLAIYLTRFLLMALAMPVNFVAAASGYTFRRFLLYDIAGQLTRIVLYGGLGYLFGSQWELINDFMSDFRCFLLGGVACWAGIYMLQRRRRQRQLVVS